MQWTDITDIAIELLEAHPDVDPLAINFVDLRNWVLALPELRFPVQLLEPEVSTANFAML